MNTQFSKVGKTYAKSKLTNREDDPWTKTTSLYGKEVKELTSNTIPQNLRLWKRL
ncbi:hypothetical protein [Flavobacterium faecale]|uniref:hypothetical protein n=1 Tax=Flavobacterium faecale TaxID=1355330 RepID=UPI00131EED0F|nr:hypothetical protein [Flavobacterium faecale]